MTDLTKKARRVAVLVVVIDHEDNVSSECVLERMDHLHRLGPIVEIGCVLDEDITVVVGDECPGCSVGWLDDNLTCPNCGADFKEIP